MSPEYTFSMCYYISFDFVSSVDAKWVLVSLIDAVHYGIQRFSHQNTMYAFQSP